MYSNDHKSSSTDLCIYRRAKTTGEIIWLSAHGYPPTRAGAEQAYQDYMDGKIDVPEADAYLGRNKQTKIEEKKNSTSTTNKTSQKTGSEDTTDTKNTDTRIQIQRIQNHRHLLQAKQQRLLQKKQ